MRSRHWSDHWNQLASILRRRGHQRRLRLRNGLKETKFLHFRQKQVIWLELILIRKCLKVDLWAWEITVFKSKIIKSRQTPSNSYHLEEALKEAKLFIPMIKWESTSQVVDPERKCLVAVCPAKICSQVLKHNAIVIHNFAILKEDTLLTLLSI